MKRVKLYNMKSVCFLQHKTVKVFFFLRQKDYMVQWWSLMSSNSHWRIDECPDVPIVVLTNDETETQQTDQLKSESWLSQLVLHKLGTTTLK
jgi:hypothetical protein